MALNNFSLGFILTARDRASRVIQGVGVSLDRAALRARLSGVAFQAGMLGVTSGIATMAAGILSLRAGLQAANVAGEWEQQLTRVRAVSQATFAEMADLRAATLTAGTTTWFSPAQAATAERELAALGLTAQQTISALPATLDLAVGGMIDLERASATVGAALNSFGLSADQAGWAVDRLLAISNTTALSADELEIALGNVSRGAGAAHQSLETMLTSVGLVRNTGVAASVAAASVSSALIHLSTRAGEVKQRLGVSLTDETTGRFRDFMEIAVDLGTALNGITNEAERAAVANALVGRYGMTAVMGIKRQIERGITLPTGEVVQNAEAVAYLAQAQREAGGTAEVFRRIVEESFIGVRDRLVAAAGTLRDVFGESLGQVLAPGMKVVWKLLGAIALAFDSLSPITRKVLAGLFIGISVATIALGAFMVSVFGIALVIPMFTTVLATFAALTVLVFPLVAVFGALVAGLVGIGIAAKFNIGGIGDYFTRQIRHVRLFFRMMKEVFTTGGLTEETSLTSQLEENLGVREFASKVWRIYQGLRVMWTGIRRGFESTFGSIGRAINGLRATFQPLLDILGVYTIDINAAAETPAAKWRRLGENIGRWLGGALGTVIGWVTRLSTEYTNFMDQARRYTESWGATWDQLVANFRGFLDALVFAGLIPNLRTVNNETDNFGRSLADVVIPSVILLTNLLSSILTILNGILYVWGAIVWLWKGVEGWGDLFGQIQGAWNPTWAELGSSLAVSGSGASSEIPAVANSRRVPEAQGIPSSSAPSPSAIAHRTRNSSAFGIVRRVRSMEDTVSTTPSISEFMPIPSQRPQRPQVIVVNSNLQLNGQSIARTTQQIQRGENEDSFSVMPAPSEQGIP